MSPAEPSAAMLRHQRAKSRADRMDAKWFGKRPGAFLRMREAVPFEWPYAEPEMPGRTRFTILYREESGQILKRTVLAFAMPAQDVATLAAIWTMLESLPDDFQGTIPAAAIDEAQTDIFRIRFHASLSALKAGATILPLGTDQPEGGLPHG